MDSNHEPLDYRDADGSGHWHIMAACGHRVNAQPGEKVMLCPKCVQLRQSGKSIKIVHPERVPLTTIDALKMEEQDDGQ